MTSREAPREDDAAATRGVWRRTRAAHFHDYSAAALRMWLAIAVCGAVALVGALATFFQPNAAPLTQLGAALLLVVAAAWFPVEIPRTKSSMGVADAFIFTVLAVLGTPAAILAAGTEGAVGAWRSTPRLTSRVSTPAAAMAAMAVCGALFQALSTLLAAWGLSLALAKLIALPLVALVPFVLTSLPQTAMVTLKRGKWPRLRVWLAGGSGMAAIYLGSALLAGMVQLTTVGQGPLAAGVIGGGTLLVILLLRQSMATREREHQAQEARVREAQRDAELNHQRFVAAFSHAAIGMAIVEPGGRILRANVALCSLLRRTEGELVGQAFHSVLHPSDVGLLQRQARDVAAAQGTPGYSIELRCLLGEDTELWVAIHCGLFSESQGPVDGLIYQLHDITSRQVAEQRLHHIAYHDNLTDLANRACFHEKVQAALLAASGVPAEAFAVMFLDLDRFKIVNDSLGHFAGNEMLRHVGRRLQRGLRQDDLVARLGGDEFAVLFRDVSSPAACLAQARRLLEAVAEPLSILGHELVPSASGGITFSHLGTRSVDELLRDADLAMYEAKAAGRGRIAVFDRSMHERIADKLALEADLRRAIGEGELSLSFQPLFSLEPYRLIGFEALARWMHPVRGPVSPAVFIELAEEAGHIEALTAWAIDKAVRQLGAWHRYAPGLEHLGVNVNISGRDLIRPDFVDRVLEVVAQHGVPAHRLTLEITETVLMSQLAIVGDALARLRASGVQLAIDDFGTGYSSLAYLGKLPVDCLKIDRSFVIAMERDAEGVEIVRAIVNLGRALGKKVVAEGIETAEQLTRLRRLGVQVGQGYLLSRPLRPEDVSDLLLTAQPQPG